MSAFEEWWMEFLGSGQLLEMTQTEQCYEAFKAGEKAGMLAAAEMAESAHGRIDWDLEGETWLHGFETAQDQINSEIRKAAEETAD